MVDSATKDSPLARLKNSYPFFTLLILCAVFIIIKIPNLKIPFYWDESSVYGPAIKAMAQKGISLFPDALSDSFSRGHPLLFFCTGALWVKLFSGSLISMHLFALVIAISFVITLFYIVKKFFDSWFALIVTAIVMAQPVFFAQSAIVLPEIFLSLWAILTIYHFVAKNKFYYFLFGTFLVLTKESGVIIIASLMVYQLIGFLTEKITLHSVKLFIQDSLLAFIPVLPFLAFLLIQHYQRGYYFFPEHMSLLKFTWKTVQEKLRHCYYNLFMQQGRAFITWSFLIIIGLFYKQVPLIIRVIMLTGLIVCVKIFFRNWALPGWLIILFILAGASICYYWMHIKFATKSKKNEKLPAIIFITVAMFITFSSINFLLSRYLLVLIPLIIIYFSYYIRASSNSALVPFYTWALLIIPVMLYYTIAGCNNTADDSPEYVQAVKLEQKMIDYLEQQNLQGKNICCQKVVMEIALTDTSSGYLERGAVFSHVSRTADKSTEYVIYTNIDFDPPFYFDESDTLPPFRVVKEFSYGIARGKLFKRVL